MPAEAARLKWNRSYFENGCLCIATGDLKVAHPDIPDEAAVAAYEASCRCSRNYVEQSNAD